MNILLLVLFALLLVLFCKSAEKILISQLTDITIADLDSIDDTVEQLKYVNEEIDTTLAFTRYEPYKKSSSRDYRILGHQYKDTLLPVG